MSARNKYTESTSHKGEVTRVKVASKLVESGYKVSEPYGDYPYDLIVDDGNELDRVQCKKGRLKSNGTIKIGLYSVCRDGTDSTYSVDEVDYFMSWCPDTEDVYALENTENTGLTIHLRVEEPRNGQTKGINFAEDFLLEENF